MATFSEILGKTDTSKTLSVPTKSLKSLPSFKGGHVVEFQVIDESGFVWTFQCSIRKKGHPKPVLSKGWRAFVHNKKLKTGQRSHEEEMNLAAAPSQPNFHTHMDLVDRKDNVSQKSWYKKYEEIVRKQDVSCGLEAVRGG
ncbi:hypothetical protein NC651_028145 [Populus alba x Populus x berolinensis]|nr:hypothetical protein NC651_028145 [Populus alba x Populus x berolinensis]